MKILLIMPKFFNYPEMISEELERMGDEVDFFDDRPSTNSFVKAIIRINKNYINGYIQRYFHQILDRTKDKKYDAVLLISGQSLSFSKEMVQQLLQSQPQAKHILYQWDSEKNFPYIKEFHDCFDKCYTFDRDDARADQTLEFLPLFYARIYAEAARKEQQKAYTYDVCFIGTAHPKKYKYVKDISAKLKEVYPRQFIYLFLPSRLVYIYRKAKSPVFKKAKYGEFEYTPLPNEKILEIMHASRCMIDSPQDNQTGLTMRVIEALGAKEKIITTNTDVVNYDFYDPHNIYVYTGDFDFNNVFFHSEYQDVEDSIYTKYSLHSWLKTVLGR